MQNQLKPNPNMLIKYSITPNKIIAEYEMHGYANFDNSLEQLYNDIGKAKIIEFLQPIFPSINDFDSYEGGIDDWFGLGSVFCYELGLIVNYKIECNKLTITIE